MAHRDNVSRVYKDFHADDHSQVSQETTTGLWTGDTASLSEFHVSDGTGGQLTKEAGAKYFVDVFNLDPSASNAEVQFSVGYGNIHGSGSPTLTQLNTSTLSTKAVYKQLQNLLLDPTDTQFKFAGVGGALIDPANEVYAIAFSRARYKGHVDPGNWQLTLSGSSGSFHFIDDSAQALGSKRSWAKNDVSFNVATGSLTGVTGSTILGITSSNSQAADKGFGQFYPQKGMIVLNAEVIAAHLGFGERVGTKGHIAQGDGDGTVVGVGENTSSAVVFVSSSLKAGYDVGGAGADMHLVPRKAFTSSLAATGADLSEQYNWAGLVRAMQLGGEFKARSAEVIASSHYFVRLNNKEFNYSNNPTFVSDTTTGKLVDQDFENNPRVYVTTVGLYSDSNELLAVAKLSRPLEKSFSKEALLRVRLDF